VQEVETTVTGTIKTKIAVLPADVPPKYRVVEIVTATTMVEFHPALIAEVDVAVVGMVVLPAVVEAVTTVAAEVVVVVGAMVVAAVHPEAVVAVRGAEAVVVVVRPVEAVAVLEEDNYKTIYIYRRSAPCHHRKLIFFLTTLHPRLIKYGIRKPKYLSPLL
jgi:hypothetical protein